MFYRADIHEFQTLFLRQEIHRTLQYKCSIGVRMNVNVNASVSVSVSVSVTYFVKIQSVGKYWQLKCEF
jgi:uncharacterized alkaline shock family protein YloU